MTATKPVTMVIVGGGPRARFFFEQAAKLTDRVDVVGATSRSAETRERIATDFGVHVVDDVDALIALRPDMALIAVQRAAAVDIALQFAAADIPMLLETPPAPDADGLRALWARVGASGLVQVGEHSMYMPAHLAVLSAVESGLIGTATSVHVSSNHEYHAVAIMRRLLGRHFEPTTVRANTFTAPLVTPYIWDRLQDDLSEKDRTTTIASVDYGDAMGLYDFTDMQWFNPLRRRRLLVRGSRGEIENDVAVRLVGDAIVESRFERRQIGVGLNHEGFDLDHISFDGAVAFSNPFRGLRVSDEDIAGLFLLSGMADWVTGRGPAPYPLAEASQDHLIGLAMQEAAGTGAAVRTAIEPWAAS